MKKRLIALCAALLAAGLLARFAAPALWDWAAGNWIYPRPYREIVQKEAAEFRLDENLVYAVMKAESGFDEKASSHAGAHGLMQLTEQTFQWVSSLYPPENGGGDILDPQDNIHCGCALLELLEKRYGSWRVALCAYNAGMGTVDGWLSVYSGDGESLDEIPYPETAAYVEKVEKYRERYEKQYENG